MMNREEAQIWIERHIDLGESLPPEVEAFVQQSSEAQLYLQTMQAVAQTLAHWEIEPPPADLPDRVMRYIEKREYARMNYPSQVILNLTWQPLKEIGAFFSSNFRFGTVMYRDLWPTVVASLAVIWGMFIVPQVQAGKTEELQQTIEQRVTAFTDQTYKQAELVAERVTRFTSEWIRSSTGEINSDEESQSEKDLGMKYSPESYRIPLMTNLGTT